MKLKGSQIVYIVLTAAIMIFIFVQSALPADLSQNESNFLVDFLIRIIPLDAETASFLIRKTAHFTEYTVLGVFLTLTVKSLWPAQKTAATAGSSPDLSLRSLKHKFLLIGVISWGIGTVYAVTDEVHQIFADGRSCELRDMLIDSIGVFLGTLIICLIHYARERKRAEE